MGDALDGDPLTLVSPVDPDPAQDADIADPGQVEQVKEFQRQTQTGKYGSVQVPAYKKDSGSSSDDSSDEKKKTGWIEFVLVDDEGNPVAGEPYTIDLPDGTQTGGSTGAKGEARLDGIPEGNCKLTYTALDKDAWEPA